MRTSMASETTTEMLNPIAQQQAIPPDVERIAMQIAESNGKAEDVGLLRWGLSRLPAALKTDAIQTAATIIDLINLYSDDESRRIGRPVQTISICFGECGPDSGCIGQYAGVSIKHWPTSGWTVDGRLFTNQREALRHAAKVATLRKLAQELGIKA